MKKVSIVTAICALAVASVWAEYLHPNQHAKEQGISITMIPTGLHDDLSPVGFAVMASPGLKEVPEKPFPTAETTFAFIEAHSFDPGRMGALDVYHHGIWVYIGSVKNDYSPQAKEQFNKLLALCQSHGIPVFLGETTWGDALSDLQQKPKPN